MLIDDVIIKVEAGNGGRGAVAFNKNLKEARQDAYSHPVLTYILGCLY